MPEFVTRPMSDTDIVDLAAITLPEQPVSSSLMFKLVDSSNKTRYLAGVQRLVQRYILALFTPKGSLPSSPEFGSSLFTDLPLGGAFTQAQIVHGFAFANAEALAAMTDTSAPVEDQLVDAQLQEIEIVGTSVNVNIRLVTGAGDVIVFVTSVG